MRSWWIVRANYFFFFFFVLINCNFRCCRFAFWSKIHTYNNDKFDSVVEVGMIIIQKLIRSRFGITTLCVCLRGNVADQSSIMMPTDSIRSVVPFKRSERCNSLRFTRRLLYSITILLRSQTPRISCKLYFWKIFLCCFRSFYKNKDVNKCLKNLIFSITNGLFEMESFVKFKLYDPVSCVFLAPCTGLNYTWAVIKLKITAAYKIKKVIRQA